MGRGRPQVRPITRASREFIDALRADGFGHWLAGFIDGEGCFSMRRAKSGLSLQCCMTMGVRADDVEILQEAQQRTGLGNVRIYGPSPNTKTNEKPHATWYMCSKRDAYLLVQILDEFPLRAKKSRDYEIWRQAVLLNASIGDGRLAARHIHDDVHRQIALLKEILEEQRCYAPNEDALAKAVVELTEQQTLSLEGFSW